MGSHWSARLRGSAADAVQDDEGEHSTSFASIKPVQRIITVSLGSMSLRVEDNDKLPKAY